MIAWYDEKVIPPIAVPSLATVILCIESDADPDYAPQIP
jgi:hypothetical protein